MPRYRLWCVELVWAHNPSPSVCGGVCCHPGAWVSPSGGFFALDGALRSELDPRAQAQRRWMVNMVWEWLQHHQRALQPRLVWPIPWWQHAAQNRTLGRIRPCWATAIIRGHGAKTTQRPLCTSKAMQSRRPPNCGVGGCVPLHHGHQRESGCRNQRWAVAGPHRDALLPLLSCPTEHVL